MGSEMCIRDRYVDDVSGKEKLHANNIYNSKYVGEKEFRYVNAAQSQDLFDKVCAGAAEKGMKINPEKTKLLCISVAVSYKPVSYVYSDNSVILSGKSMRLLGSHFDSSANVSAHVSAILRKVRYRLWSIHNLKRLGLCPDGLIRYSCL